MIVDTPPDSLSDPPADAVAGRLRAIWREVFGPKGRTEGAHVMRISIGIGRMTRFLDAVEAELGIRIPITALMRLGTVDALTEAITLDAWPPAAPLIRLRDGTPDQTLYVVSAGTGLVLELCDLAAQVDIPGQIYALQLPGLDGEADPLTSVAAMGRHYADAIAARPDHTCHLIGYSFGGLVCVEIARLLDPATHPAGLVGLIDSACYERYWPRGEWLRVATRRSFGRLAEMRHMGPGAAILYLGGRLLALKRHFERRTNTVPTVTESVYYVGGLPPTLQAVRDASIAAYERHDPQPVSIPLTLFQSDRGNRHGCNPARLWHDLTPDLTVVPLPGSHVTMLRKPHVLTLAREISDRVTGRGSRNRARPEPLDPIIRSHAGA